ncbi:hypothetical protein [Vibrio pectenicida]|uniref:Uncharacterized protein n=1 Tax=Vibrio pectenicida TaxID=62763 RepID=A0A427TWS3_9VIBR|nr:hypothetical protein [Vibrio pectenicida]RSD28928.1 hypothetical protein EJA03_18755 [Vibrio pectenicida]
MNVNLFSLIGKGIETSTRFHLLLDCLMLSMCIFIPQAIFFILPAISEQISMGTNVMTIGVFFVVLTKLCLIGWWSTLDERETV